MNQEHDETRDEARRARENSPGREPRVGMPKTHGALWATQWQNGIIVMCRPKGFGFRDVKPFPGLTPRANSFRHYAAVYGA